MKIVLVPHAYEQRFQFASFPTFKPNVDDSKIVKLMGKLITNFVKTGYEPSTKPRNHRPLYTFLTHSSLFPFFYTQTFFKLEIQTDQIHWMLNGNQFPKKIPFNIWKFFRFRSWKIRSIGIRLIFSIDFSSR